jgi:Flp pilus assembly protein TadD
MKHLKAMKFVPLIMLLFVLAGCNGLKKMAKNADTIQYTLKPAILETHAGEVALTVDGNFPPKFFAKKAVVTITPTLVYEGGERALKSVVVQGQKVQENNKVINYTEGGSFTYTDKTAFTDAMRKSEVVVKVKATAGSKSVNFTDRKIGDGVIATPTLLVIDPKVIIGTTKKINQTPSEYNPEESVFQQIVPDLFSADILYKIQQATLNQDELKKDDIKALQTLLDEIKKNEKLQLNQIEISSYASPDGSLDLNTGLSTKRGSTAEGFLKKELKKNKITDAKVNSTTTPEDWEGFKTLVEKSNIQDKQVILRVLSMYQDVEVREKEIKNMAAAYEDLAGKILPELRRSKYNVSMNKVGKSDEEILTLANSNPSALNQAELLYAATLVKDLDNKLNIYKSFSTNYPSDWRGPNNEGFIYWEKNDVNNAKFAFEKAKSLDANSFVLNNLGAAELATGNVKAAKEYFMAALGSNNKVAYNLALINVKEAKYSEAVTNLGECTNFNAALANLLNGDAKKAATLLENKESKTGMDYYLLAVVAARQGNSDKVYGNLKTALNQDASLAKKAKTDLEFYKLFETNEFKEIVK